MSCIIQIFGVWFPFDRLIDSFCHLPSDSSYLLTLHRADPRSWRQGHKNWSLRWGTGGSCLSEPHQYRTISQHLVKQWTLHSVYTTWDVTEGFICCSSSLRSGLRVHLAWISHLPTLMSTKFWQGDKWANASLCDRRAYRLNHNIHDFWGGTVTTNWVVHTCSV